MYSHPDCYKSPCVHGECIETDMGYVCNCEPGFFGENCADGKCEFNLLHSFPFIEFQIPPWPGLAVIRRSVGPLLFPRCNQYRSINVYIFCKLQYTQMKTGQAISPLYALFLSRALQQGFPFPGVKYFRFFTIREMVTVKCYGPNCTCRV